MFGCGEKKERKEENKWEDKRRKINKKYSKNRGDLVKEK